MVKWVALVYVTSLVVSVAREGFERVPLPEPKHPALIKVLGDSATGQVFSPGRLWWPEGDRIVQLHNDARLGFSLWDVSSLRRLEGIKTSEATLSHDARHLVMRVYNLSLIHI